MARTNRRSPIIPSDYPIRSFPQQNEVFGTDTVENTGGSGIAGGHWRETVFGTELMAGFINEAGNPLSLMT
jgi:hypothetical protein